MGMGNGAVVVHISLLPHMTPDSGTQYDDNNIYCRHDRVGTFTIGQSTIEKKRFCVMGKDDLITLMPFLGAGLSLEIRKEFHLMTKMLLNITVM